MIHRRDSAGSITSSISKYDAMLGTPGIPGVPGSLSGQAPHLPALVVHERGGDEHDQLRERCGESRAMPMPYRESPTHSGGLTGSLLSAGGGLMRILLTT